MDTKEALDLVAQYGERNGITGTLETLTAMADAKDAGELEGRDLVAFNVAFAGFRSLFNGGMTVSLVSA